MANVAQLNETIDMPKGITAVLDKNVLTVKGANGTLARSFIHPKVKMMVEGAKVTVSCSMPRRKDKALVGTWAAHVRNMVRGAAKDYECTMKIVFSHFPIKTTVKEDTVVIENFLGERFPHRAGIVKGAKVKVSGDQVVITGADLEAVGQTAANIERATKIYDRDPRVFQDGIYIVKKGL